MAMQQSGKGAGDEASRSGPNPALTEEDAEEFASSFTPAWDAPSEESVAQAPEDAPGTANATLVDAVPVAEIAAAAAVAAAAVAVAPPVVALAPPPPAAAPEPPPPAKKLNPKQTLIGTAPQANRPAGAPMNEPPQFAQQPAPSGEGRWQEKVPSRPPPAHPQGPPAQRAVPAPTRNAARAVSAVSADPFKAGASASSSDEYGVVPKRSSKALIVVVGGLAVAAGLGLFVKFGMTDDSPKPAPTQAVVGPAVTTAEIPPPPPKVDMPPAATTVAATPTTKNDPTPAVTALATPPPRAAEPPPRAAEPPRTAVAPPRSASDSRPRGPALPPPQAAAPPQPAAAPPKTPPNAPTRGIVRDNPF